MAYQLSKKSLSKLEGVHDDLVRVVKRAIEITQVDFTVLEGVRSKARQAQLVASGASKTMDGRHLTGHAVDLAAYVAGSPRWDWPANLACRLTRGASSFSPMAAAPAASARTPRPAGSPPMSTPDPR